MLLSDYVCSQMLLVCNVSVVCNGYDYEPSFLLWNILLGISLASMAAYYH